MSYTNVNNLGHAHQEWLKALDFYKTEIGILEKRLVEVNNKNTAMDSRAEAEHFQNQFIIQKNNIDELKHIINEHAHQVFEEVKVHVGRVEESKVAEHKKIEEEVNSVEKIINELRHDFGKYAAKWM